jgi:hypothetical protein
VAEGKRTWPYESDAKGLSERIPVTSRTTLFCISFRPLEIFSKCMNGFAG